MATALTIQTIELNMTEDFEEGKLHKPENEHPDVLFEASVNQVLTPQHVDIVERQHSGDPDKADLEEGAARANDGQMKSKNLLAPPCMRPTKQSPATSTTPRHERSSPTGDRDLVPSADDSPSVSTIV